MTSSRTARPRTTVAIEAPGAAHLWGDRIWAFFLVEPSEQRQLGYLASIFFLAGIGLALGRGSVDALFFTRFGVDLLPAMYAVLAPSLGLAGLLYAAYADRMPAERTFRALTATAAIAIAACWLAMAFGAVAAYPTYFIVYEIASELLWLQLALYMGHNLDTQQIKRLAPLCFAAVQAGMVVGGIVLALGARAIGTDNVLLLWLLTMSIVIAQVAKWHRRHGTSPYYRPPRKGRPPVYAAVEQVRQGLRFLTKSPLARWSSAGLFFMVIAFFVLSYSLNKIYSDRFGNAEDLGAFFGGLTAVTSGLALGIQLMLTGRLLRRFGVQRVNLIAPLAAVSAFFALLASFTMPSALIGSIVKDAVFPAIRRPARNLLQAALPDQMQGRVRALAVALILPLALALTGALLYLGQTSDATRYFVYIGIGASMLYFVCNLRLNRSYVAELIETLRERVLVERPAAATLAAEESRTLLAEYARGLDSGDETIVAAYAQDLAKLFPAEASTLLPTRLAGASPALRDRLLTILCALPEPQDDTSRATLHARIRSELAGADDHLCATIWSVLFARRDPDARAQIPNCLSSVNARIAAAGIFGVHRYDVAALRTDAQARWQALLASPVAGDVLAGLDMVVRLPNGIDPSVWRHTFNHPNERVRAAALRAVSALPDTRVDPEPPIRCAMEDSAPAVRQRALQACGRLSGARGLDIAIAALDDSHTGVREQALRIAQEQGPVGTEAILTWLEHSSSAPAAQIQTVTALAAKPELRGRLDLIARERIDRALAWRTAASALTRTADTPAQHLLALALGERAGDTIDLALASLEGPRQSRQIGIVRAALRSKERRDAARAIEVLRAHGGHPLLLRLAKLFDPVARPVVGTLAQSAPDEIVQWCAHQSDNWLRECAGYAAVKGEDMSELVERILILKRSETFAAVSTEDLRSVARELDEESCAAGERLFDIHEPGDRIYFIRSGRIGIAVDPDPLCIQFVSVLGPNECFGEMSMFDGLPRSATARALEDSKLYSLSQSKMRALIANCPELALGMLKSLSLRLRDTTRRAHVS